MFSGFRLGMQNFNANRITKVLAVNITSIIYYLYLQLFILPSNLSLD